MAVAAAVYYSAVYNTVVLLVLGEALDLVPVLQDIARKVLPTAVPTVMPLRARAHPVLGSVPGFD